MTDSMNSQNDFPQLALAFDGTKLRIAGHLARMASGANTNWVFSSNDGMTWATSAIPPDAEDDGARSFDLDFEAGKLRGPVAGRSSGGAPTASPGRPAAWTPRRASSSATT